MTEHVTPQPPAPDQPPGEEPSPAPGAQRQAAESAEYQVLARKYRPATFAGLIGQEAMVRTLTNAMASGRLAHAFVLTGVRGVGKTTAARIIARCLNCIGPDGGGGITPEPCGVCEHCRAIAEDRHMDVIEMDAASRTGVDDIRELIDGVRYRPTTARYKVYIIDEVHMLSKNAFNALLKTLEEPPEHVKFIFATTEVRKIPVTVLSRCQRFDLRRIDAETLAAHFKRIVEEEGAKVTDGALNMIVRAADGSVRDGLSLFDQAIAHCGGEVGEDQVRRMLGLADRTITFDLLDAVMKGDADTALRYLGQQYAAGADPAVVLEDMLELTHWLTRIKVVPGAADAFGVPEAERVRGGEMAGKLSMAAVARAWQMLLKGLGEVRLAPRPEQAAEMILVRLAFASGLPTPAEALKALDDGGAAAPAPRGGPPGDVPPTTYAGGAPATPGETAPRAQAPKAPANEAPRTDAGPGAGDPAGGAPGTRAGPAAGKRAEAAEHPLVKAVMETFPGATIDKVSARSDAEPPADEDA
jgi:DNA polymerase-3 subunit gamma/tau